MEYLKGRIQFKYNYQFLRPLSFAPVQYFGQEAESMRHILRDEFVYILEYTLVTQICQSVSPPPGLITEPSRLI